MAGRELDKFFFKDDILLNGLTEMPCPTMVFPDVISRTQNTALLQR